MKQLKILTGEQGNCPLGLTAAKNRISVSVVWAGESCSLVLFHRGEEEPWQVIPMDPGERQGDVWSLTLGFTGALPRDLEYCFEADGQLMADPCGRAMRGWEEWGETERGKRVLRSPVRQETFDWSGDARPEIPMEDCVIYRLHVRGFTKHNSSGVRDKGTFKAVAQKIPYMKELGITTVELMPVMEFQEVITQNGQGPFAGSTFSGRLNYWGYTGGFRFAPKAAYSSGRPKEKDPVREFKCLVKELHAAGLEVVTELFFDGSESAAFVLDAARYWVREYHLDGIRLVGNVSAAMVAGDPYLSRVKVFASGWGDMDMRRAASRKGFTRRLAEYNDGFMQDMRRFLKGDEGMVRAVMNRMTRSPQEFGIVNYMAHTNGFTLMDMVSYERKHNEANGENNKDGSDFNYSWNCGEEGPTRSRKIMELRRKQLRNAMLLLFLSQGTPLLESGDEFGHTKSGNNNSYCQDNAVSWLNWSLLKANRSVYEFARQAIAFRRAHPVLRMAQQPRMMDYLACGCPDVSFHGVKAWYPEFENFRRELAVLYCGEYGKREDGSPDDYIFVICNMHWQPHEFAVPTLPKNRRWFVAMDTDRKDVNGFYEPGSEPLLENQKMYPAAGRSIAVLLGKIAETEPPQPQKKSERKGKAPSAESKVRRETEAPSAESKVRQEKRAPLDESKVRQEKKAPSAESKAKRETEAPSAESKAKRETEAPSAESGARQQGGASE